MIFWNKYQSLLITVFNTYSSLPFSLHAESEVWPRTCFPKVSPCQCSCSVPCAFLCFVQYSLKVQNHETVPSRGWPSFGLWAIFETRGRFWSSSNKQKRRQKKKKRQPEKRLYTSISKERLILLQIPQGNLWPVKCSGGIPNKRHQAWHVPWYLHSNGESSFTGQTPKMIYYLNQSDQ